MANAHMKPLEARKPRVCKFNEVHRATCVNEGELEIAAIIAPTGGVPDVHHIRLAEVATYYNEISARRRRWILAAAMAVIEVHVRNVAATVSGKIGSVSKIGSPYIPVLPVTEYLETSEVVPRLEISSGGYAEWKIRPHSTVSHVAPYSTRRISHLRPLMSDYLSTWTPTAAESVSDLRELGKPSEKLTNGGY